MNHSNNHTARRNTARASIFGTTHIHLRNPYITAWWSAAFPGFGHLLLSKYVQGFILIIWEVIVNTQAHINLAIIYSFQGAFDLAKDIVDTRWLLAYMPVYLFGIWDCYRTTVDMNKAYILAEQEEHRYKATHETTEINQLNKRNPAMAVLWSLFIPGLGHLYTPHIFTAFFIFFWAALFLYFSHTLEAITLLFLEGPKQATPVLHADWFLFLPSVYCFAIFDSYVNTVENNKRFKREQQRFLKSNYQCSDFKLRKGQKVR